MARPHDLHNFITAKLESKLRRDTKANRIQNEGDLQSCTYFHLRRYIESVYGSKWHIHNRYRIPCGRAAVIYPDIAVTHRGQPEYVLELKDFSRKENVKRRAKKDRSKLKQVKKSVRRGYFLYLIWKKDRDRAPQGFYSRRGWETDYYFEVAIAI